MTKKQKLPIAFLTAFALVLTVLMLFPKGMTADAAWDGTVGEAFSGGDGSASDPYTIANGKQLAYLAQQVNGIDNDDPGETYEGKYFRLTADIDLGGREWKPIGHSDYDSADRPKKEVKFSGTFDGNGHTISNGKITVNKKLGFFGINYGTIKNLYLENINIKSYHCIGGICAFNYGTVEGCGLKSGKLEIDGYNGGDIGGVVGDNYGKVSRCFNNADVINGVDVAGVVGSNNRNSTVENCYNTGSVSATSGGASGICASNYGAVKNCFNAGEIRNSGSGTSDTSNAICCNAGMTSTFENCYNVSDVFNGDLLSVVAMNGSASVTSVEHKTLEEICGDTLPTGFDADVWKVGSVGSLTVTEGRFGKMTYIYPSLKNVGTAAAENVKYYNFGTTDDTPDWQGYTLISTAEEFKALGEDSSAWDKNYVLGADIDLDGADITPIGSKNTSFKGKFSGGGHIVSNFKFYKFGGEYVGLFGYSEGLIMDLGVENASVTGETYVGGLCGKNNGTIVGCYSTATVSGYEDVGGVCGASEGTVTNCYNTGIVNGTGNVGGVCGANYGAVANCYNEGTVAGGDGVGGVCGYNTYGSAGYTVENCYNTGTVRGISKVGGVCGYNDHGTIENCYNTNTVSADTEVGGVCGYNTDVLYYCYSTGAVSGSSKVGGVCGSVESGTVANCYNTGAVSGVLEIVGGVCGENFSGTVEACYSTGELSGTSYVGGVCGQSQGTVTNCYYNKDVCSFTGIDGKDIEGSATGLTSNELSGLPTGFDSSVWTKGSCTAAADSENKRLRTTKYTFPSLTGIGKAYTVSGVKQYNFGIDGKDNWQEYTLIENEAQFIAVGNDSTSWGKNYVLARDLDLSGKTITPIDTFSGKFSGDGHTIKNVKMSTNEGLSVGYGLFGINKGLIMHLAVEGDISSTLSNSNAYVGGICGKNDEGGKIFCCSFEGKVYNGGNNAVGGICGKNWGLIKYCYAFADVTSDRNDAGGICGTHDGNASYGINSDIAYCYFVGKVSKNNGNKDNVGAIVGYSNRARYFNCYYDKERSDVVGDECWGVGKTTQELCENSKLADLRDTSIWTLGSYTETTASESGRLRTVEYTYPSLVEGCTAKSGTVKQYNYSTDDTESWKDCTVITTADEFKALTKDGADWNKNYVLGADIDLNGEVISPIGNENTSFKGKFSGDGHIVSNFKINKPKDDCIGLFGDSCELIMNLGVENAEVTGKCNVGGICGRNTGTIVNCYYAGTVSGKDDVGGICGFSIGDGIISNCYNTGTISGNAKAAGGICGFNQSNIAITNCYNAGKVSGNGVCGYYDLKGTATNCYYNKDICTEGDKNATGLTTIQMTDNDVFKTMDLDITVWGKMDNDRGNKIAYYPELRSVKGSTPSIKYETKLDISVADGDGSEKTMLDISALVKFDGMSEFKADETALTSGKGSFSVTLFDEILVSNKDICDNTTVTVSVPHIDQIDEPDLTLNYEAGTSSYLSDSSRKLLDGAVAVYDGTETKVFDDLTKALAAYKTSTNALTINLREDANVKTLSLPTKAESITFAGRGKLNFSGTSITFPTDTTISIEIVGTNAKPLAIKSAAKKTLTINKNIENLGTLGGTATTVLNVNADLTAASVSAFKEVNVADEKILASNGNVSGVVTLNGSLKLTNPKSTAAITNIGTAKLIFTDANGAITKATVKDIIDKLTVEITDSSDSVIKLSNSRTILWAGGNINFTDKVDIANKSEADQTLNAFLYGKEIKAEYAGAVSLSENGGEAVDYPNIDLAFKAITNKASDYTITLYNDVTASKFAIPSKANSITFTGTGSLNLNMTSLSVPTDVTFDVEVNGINAKPLAVRAAAKKTLTINKEISNLGTLGGTATSILNVNTDLTAAGISAFMEVNVADEKILTSNGNVSGIVTLNGALKLTNPKSTAVITNIGVAKLMLEDTNGTVPKATVKDITIYLYIAVVDENNETISLDSGRTVLWAGGNIDFTEKIAIENMTSTSKDLNAFLYSRDIRAEYADTLTLSDGTDSKNYPNFELALKAMTDPAKDYTVTVNENTSTAKFALPALSKANSVTIKSENEAKTITLTNITAVSAKTPLKLENIKLESTKPYTISTTSDLTLDKFASDSITAVKGGAKATLTLGETTPIDKVSGFGTTKVTNEFRTGTTFTTTDLELTETANLIVSNTKTPATTKTLNGAEGSVITLDTGFTPIKVTGTTADSISGTIKLKANESIDENTVLFTAKYAGNNVFDVTEIQPQTELDYTVTSISGKAYMKPIVFEMNNTGYALWTDVMTIIENVKMSEAQYTVKLLDDADINGAMKLPKAGTYGKLTIASDNKTLTFTGSITATGELEVANTNLDSARNNTSSKYTISAGKYPFTAENADLSLASITGTADVTLKNTRTSGTVRAGKLTLNGEDTILGTITASELGSTEEGTVLNILNTARGVMSITKNGITENSEEITIKLVDESENAVTAENLSVIASSFTGNYNGELKLSTENGEFSIILSKNKLVLADSITAANGLLEADEEENDDTDTSEEEPADETPEDNSDDTSEEEPTDDDNSGDDVDNSESSGDTSANGSDENVTEKDDIFDEMSA